MNPNVMIVPFQYKADSDDGFLEGYASVFGNVDHHGDVMVKGAFSKTVRERIPKGEVPLIDSHGLASGIPVPSAKDVIGTVVAAREDDRGLYIRAKLSGAESVQDTRTKLREGHIKTMSIGYVPVRVGWDTADVDGQKMRVRMLQEVKLHEVSIAPIPANELAAIVSVKSLVSDAGDWSDAGREALAQVWDAEYKMAEPDPEPTIEPDPEPDPAPEPSAEQKSRELVRRAEALLDGRDPDELADPAKIAGAEMRMDVIDQEIQHLTRLMDAKSLADIIRDRADGFTDEQLEQLRQVTT